MKEIYTYLNDSMSKEFLKFPHIDFSFFDKILKIAYDNTCYDYYIKNNSKLTINSSEELVDIMQVDSTIEAVFLYRLEREIFLQDKENIYLSYLARLMRNRTGCEIYYSTEIGKGFNIQHGFGIVIGPRFKIGDNFIVHQGVTLGQKNLNSPNERILIGNNVTIFAGATVLGNIEIGNNVQIGANSVVLSNVESNSIYVGTPAKKIKMKL